MKKIIIFMILAMSIYSDDDLGSLLEAEDYSVDSIVEENLKEKKIDVEDILGEAFLEEGENFMQLVRGDILNQGDTMITLDNTKVQLAFDKDIEVTIGEKSKVYFENLKGDYRLEEMNDVGMDLVFGKVYSNIKRKLKKGAKFEIKTGSVVAGVRGTKFTITYYKDGRIEVKVFEGTVAVYNREDKKVEEVNAQELLIIYPVTEIMEKLKHYELDEKFIETTYDTVTGVVEAYMNGSVDLLKKVTGDYFEEVKMFSMVDGKFITLFDTNTSIFDLDIYDYIKEESMKDTSMGDLVTDVTIGIE